MAKALMDQGLRISKTEIRKECRWNRAVCAIRSGSGRRQAIENRTRLDLDLDDSKLSSLWRRGIKAALRQR
jgi:hypothetical protein